ncbi:uncharacterized protein EHS24_007622 [Apiotrichum porosum]|uniref:Uncharacterized protein n=1 Tax=Apiotrichum porosum TaxID=105984 RepID=A0A427XV75_9TREE|nr:uncharacterized protein EHS24_007622 [Apiotrichum porosum]RSH82631.1 hypothetical protein EHS24_007622 [Apiotrichum porosum]
MEYPPPLLEMGYPPPYAAFGSLPEVITYAYSIPFHDHFAYFSTEGPPAIGAEREMYRWVSTQLQSLEMTVDFHVRSLSNFPSPADMEFPDLSTIYHWSKDLTELNKGVQAVKNAMLKDRRRLKTFQASIIDLEKEVVQMESAAATGREDVVSGVSNGTEGPEDLIGAARTRPASAEATASDLPHKKLELATWRLVHKLCTNRTNCINDLAYCRQEIIQRTLPKIEKLVLYRRNLNLQNDLQNGLPGDKKDKTKAKA